MQYSYNISNTSTNEVDLSKLQDEIKESDISIDINFINKINDDIIIYFVGELTIDEKSTLDSIITNHNPVDTLVVYENIVQNAMNFFNQIMVTYAAENITMGITVYGKTKIVADYLSDVMRYGQSGSLYEVINEIDALIADTIPSELSPFVTQSRLEDFKAKINAYLGN